jgi:LuxR family maltose regulon positive regulatory protein
MSPVAQPQRAAARASRGASHTPAAKFQPPRRPLCFVARPRLDEMLDGASAGRVTLVSAHAGTGKTVLLASWIDTRVAAAWVGVDREDNWSRRFWSAVELALVQADAFATGPVDDGQPPSPGRIVERLSGEDTPVVLVLDDLHELENPVVLRELQALLDRAPPRLHVILSTRADPPLRLQRLRLSGELGEIRAADLAFTAGECREVLVAADHRLTDDDVETLRARTEGWAAGIRLASLSLADEPDPSGALMRFAGDDRAVADYLLNEVLARQGEERREFLLRTSVPDRLSVELAERLTRRRDAGRMLAELEAANLLVSSNSDGELRYRYQGLLLEFLRAQLRRTRPDDLALLHRASAQWHWAHREPTPALREALAAGSWDLADEIVGEAWHVVALAVPELFDPPLLGVPREALAAHRRLGLAAAAASLRAGDRSGASQRFQEASTLDDGSAVRLEVEASLARFDGDEERRLALALALADAPVEDGYDAVARLQAQQAVALAHVGASEAALGEPQAAEEHLELALDLAQRGGLNGLVPDVLGGLSVVELVKGNLRRAAELAGEAAKLADPLRAAGTASSITPQLVLGWAHYQWDELATAAEHLDRAAVAAAGVDRTGRIAAAVLSALVAGAEGSRGAADGIRRLHGAAAELAGWVPPGWLTTTVATVEARLLAARGDGEAASLALGAGGLKGCAGAEAVVRARLLLVGGRADEALRALEPGTRDPVTEPALYIEAQVLEAVARALGHDEVGAGAVLESALEAAEPNSYRRPFLDGGPAVRALLVQRVRNGTAHRSFVGELLAAFDKRAPRVELTRAELLEPLSDRERAVLRYLPTMMSNVEIAGELFVTSNTVKTHLKSIYRKLGVARRRDAVERARALQLL